MLSAFAALREKQPPVTEKITDVETETDSELDEPMNAVDASVKRKQSPKPVPPSRKRRKGNQNPRYFSEAVTEVNNDTVREPTRGFSPSEPTGDSIFQDTKMLDITSVHASKILSSFSPSFNQNVFFSDMDNPTKLYLIVKPSETLSFIGTVGITVFKGSISLFGSTMPASSTRHEVYAPKNYPLATIECITHSNTPEGDSIVPDLIPKSAATSGAVLMIEDLCSGVQGLRQVCGSNVATFEAPSDFAFDFKLAEFFPIRHGDTSYNSFIIPHSWSSALVEAENLPVCIAASVKGPRGCGKSTFSRTLVNRLLLRHKYVAYLDCDPGQTEFTPPGIVSLHVLTEPIYGPPFTHLRQPFRAHFIGSTTIQSSPGHYQDCILALLDAYRLDVKYSYEFNHLPESADEMSGVDDIKGIPLVINHFGWNKGAGAEAIQFIESQVDLTHVYAFESGQTDTTRQTGGDSRLQTISLNYLEPIKLSKPDHGQVDRRSIMIMSYLHHRKVVAQPIRWHMDLPLCSHPPWEVTWADAIDRIVLIGSGSEDVADSEVLRVMNGGIVALVTMDSVSSGRQQENGTTRTIPYTQGATPPPPNFSNCVGMALVRGVRASAGALHVLTPVQPALLARARILVMGEIKLPIWGMLDFRTDARSIDEIAGVKLAAVPFLTWASGTDNTPGAKKLRVRRNLMRKNQSMSHHVS